MDDTNYTDKDRDRMRYYLKEMEEKFKTYPNSLTLRNGIARVRQILHMPVTVTSIDTIAWIDEKTEQLKRQKEGL